MKFVTDILSDREPNLLTTKIIYLPLLIVSLDDPSEVREAFEAPPGGWTHEKLISLEIPDAALLPGADAILGGEWIGSTEV